MNNIEQPSIALNDEAIRVALVLHLRNMSKSPKAILEEVRVHNGNAIADVVAVHSQAHCYEIKGENDNIYRALKQSKFYDRAFKKVTLVTTEKSIRTAERLMPNHWGVMLARVQKGHVLLRHVRKAENSSSFDKQTALLTLWKSELLGANLSLPHRSPKYLNRHQLIELIAKDLNKENLLNFIGDKLVERNFSLETKLAYT